MQVIKDKNASSEANMQRAISRVSQSCDNNDLTISSKDRLRFYSKAAPGKP